MSHHTELAKEWFQRVWCDQDASAIDQIMSPDCKLYGLAPEPLGREDFRAFYDHFRQLISDIRIEVSHTVENGDWLGTHAVAEGTHQPSGKPIRFEGTSVARIVDGQLLESHETWDFLTLLVQIGEVSPETVGQLFGASD